MSATLLALTPVFGLIVIGYVLKSRGTFTDAFWNPAERLRTGTGPGRSSKYIGARTRA